MKVYSRTMFICYTITYTYGRMEYKIMKVFCYPPMTQGMHQYIVHITGLVLVEFVEKWMLFFASLHYNAV